MSCCIIEVAEDNLEELFGECHKGLDGAQGSTSEDDPSSIVVRRHVLQLIAKYPLIKPPTR